MKNLITSLKLVAITLAVCCLAYPLVVLAFAQLAVPDTAGGSLLRDQAGRIIGSRLIAQAFTSPGYFWPRPSAVDYNGEGAGGSNLSPTNPELRGRVADLLSRDRVSPRQGIPADLVTASGSGLDPHISEAAARFQVPRIAAARGVGESAVESLIEAEAFAPAGRLSGGTRIVNVLEINLALDALAPGDSSRRD